jgi:hypothetical protein
LADRNSRLGKLAGKIRREYAAVYDLSTPRAARLARRVADLEALATKTLVSIGHDKKSTLRAATGAARAAATALAQLEGLGVRRLPKPFTVHDLVAAVQEEVRPDGEHAAGVGGPRGADGRHPRPGARPKVP